MSVEFEAHIPTVQFGFITVRSDNYTDFVGAVAEAQDFVPNLMTGAEVPGVTEQAQKNLAAQGLIPATPAPVAPIASTPGQWQTTAAPAAPAAAPMCNHGQRTTRTGTNARGNWTGHFCPLPKGDPGQCKPIFA